MAPPTTLKLRIKNVTFLKNVLEVLSDPFSKANFEFSSAGLELQAMDPSRCTLVVFQLCPEAFDPYICNSGGTSVGLNLADMAKAFSFASNDDIVTIEAQDGVEDVVIMFKSPGKFRTRTYFALATLCPDPVLILGL
jgi:proliferating cell nuclear antigen PCNA